MTHRSVAESSGDESRWRTGDRVAIPGDYQYRALHEGPAIQRFWHARRLDLVQRVAMPEPGMRALDVGCGSAIVSDFLATQGADVDAVDANEDAVRFVREKLARENLRVHLGLANELDFPKGSFDLVVCMEVIEHMATDQAQALAGDLARLLAPGGRLLVTTPNSLSLWPLIERAMDLFHLAPRMLGEQHVASYTARRLGALLERAGLDVCRVGRFCGIAPFSACVSRRLADMLDRLEWWLHEPLGNLLFAVAGRRG
jgi:2-polyprenyl-3-methyl-5-hydroxy-6-metoxy-1,4-benzoquinol methylase